MDSYWVAQWIMYAVFLFSLVAYATLDGFDLGVGSLHLFARGNQERRIMINAIGPVWDSNSTWIVIAGGVLFAAFPKAFAVLAPNLYTPIMALLFGFMLRAAAIEFRGKKETLFWRSFWDRSFCFASLLLTLLFGLILGNLIKGIPLNSKEEIVGGLLALITWYPILVALLVMACCTMHGALYLLMKSEGEFQKRAALWGSRSFAIFLFLWILVTSITFSVHSHMIAPFIQSPLLSIVPLLSCGTIYAIFRSLRKEKEGWPFLFSSLSISLLLLTFAIGIYPNIAYSTIDPEKNSLTFMNSSVSELPLWILVAISITGASLSFFYIPYVYKIFKGKVKIDSMSY